MSSIDSDSDVVILTDEDGMPTGTDLPILAETYSADRPSSIDAPGLIAGVLVDSSTSTPYIEEGVIHLPASGGSGSDIPLAEYNPSEQVFKTGLIAGAAFNSAISDPIIDNGIIYIPPPPDEAPLAQYNPSSPSSAISGIIAGITTSAISQPTISNGVIILPESSGGDLKGLYVNGNALPWSRINNTRLTGFTISTADATYAFDLYATYSNGYLSFYFV